MMLLTNAEQESLYLQISNDAWDRAKRRRDKAMEEVRQLANAKRQSRSTEAWHRGFVILDYSNDKSTTMSRSEAAGAAATTLQV
jgi:hypothetical protein